MQKAKIKNIVRKKYRQVATTGCGCGCGNISKQKIAKDIGYTKNELNEVGAANLGLGCGNPVALSKIRPGDKVLDLGSGAGIDCFLASNKVGPKGLVVGIDMTKEMVALAKTNAKNLGMTNVSFKTGDIEKLPIKNGQFDVIITNCVINLASDKSKVFGEAYRVLKSGGRMYVSDIVLLAQLKPNQKNDHDLISGCVAGALLKAEYLNLIKKNGFSVKILKEDRSISKKQYGGIRLESILVEAKKLINK